MSEWAAELDHIRAARDQQPVHSVPWPTPILDADDPLQQQYDTRATLWQAPVRWSDPILGSTDILEAGNSPWGLMHVVYSFDPRADARPALIAHVSSRLVDLWRGEHQNNPLADWAQRLRGRTRSMQLRVPDSLANGYAVFISSLLICRVHLPGERMRFERLPIFAPAEPDAPIMAVPCALWPQSLIADWTAETDG